MEDNYNVVNKDQKVISVKEWFITIRILMVPIVNLVMPFVWAFGGGSSASKANYFKAYLIMILISIILVALFWGTIFAFVASQTIGRSY